MTRLNARKSNPFLKLLLGLLGAFVLIQLIPYGHAHTNPPIAAQPKWDSPQTEQLFNRSCADCHSNKTVWPWYSNVAPVSWMVQRHVDEGRSKFNINEVGFGRDADNAAEEVRSGSMPEPTYYPMHPTARLSDAERDQLVKGLATTFGDKGGEGGGEGGGEKD